MVIGTAASVESDARAGSQARTAALVDGFERLVEKGACAGNNALEQRSKSPALNEGNDMDSSTDGGFCFLHSWSDDLDPAARRSRSGAGAFVNLDGVYLPGGDAPAVAARKSGAGASTTLSALAVAAAWLLMRAP